MRVEPIFDVINIGLPTMHVFAVDVGNVNINFDRLMHLHDDQKVDYIRGYMQLWAMVLQLL